MSTLKRACVRWVLYLVAAFVAQGFLHAQIPLDRQVGEVFVAVGNGQYQVWHPTPPTATLVETITQNFNNVNFVGATAGCAFDPTYHPFTTNQPNNFALRSSIEDPQNGIAQIDVSAHGGAEPTSVAFDGAGNSYIGNAGGNGLIQEFSPSGAFIRTLPINTESLEAGTPWIDLSADGNTIYFTNGGTTIFKFDVSSSEVSTFTSVEGANLKALRVLPTPGGAEGNGVVLVAALFDGSSRVLLFDANGSLSQDYSIFEESDLEAVTLDPNGTSFWAGSPSSGNFYRANLVSGAVEVSANTGLEGRGAAGLCAYGGFGAALYQPLRFTTTFTSASSPGCAVNAQDHSLADCTFSTKIPDTETGPNSFGITLNGINFANAPNGLTLTYNYSQIDPGAGTSDTGLACVHTSPDGTKCEVHSVDADPTNGSNDTNIYKGFDTNIFSIQSAINPVVLKNELHELTSFLIRGSIRSGDSDTTKSIFTFHEQPIQVPGSQSCGYTSPVLNSQYQRGRVIPFKFQAVSPPATCSKGSSLTNLHPRLVLVQLTNLSSPGAAPHRVDYKLQDGTLCTETSPCYFRNAGQQWILQIDSSTLQGGGTQYLGTTIDDAHQIPIFSNTNFGVPAIFILR